MADDDPGLVKRDASFQERVTVGVEPLFGDPGIAPARCISEEWFAYEAYFPVPELEQVAHRLGCPSVVVNHDGRGGITKTSFNLNGRDACLKGELDILGMDSGREDNSINTALEERLNALAFPVFISASIEEQDVEALLRGGLLSANGDFGDERVGERAVQDQAQRNRLAPPQFLGDNVKAVTAVTESRLHPFTRFRRYVAVPVDHPRNRGRGYPGEGGNVS